MVDLFWILAGMFIFAILFTIWLGSHNGVLA